MILRFTTASLLLILTTLVQAAPESIGKVILSFGQNMAVAADGSERELKRQSELYAEDLLKTGAKGRLQVRFSDGSRLSLKPGTEFKIEQYQFASENPEEGKALYKLLKGGMRTLSGQIGKSDPEAYQLDAVVATIGIRGTDFSITRRGDKLSGSVTDGRINVQPRQGDDRDIPAGRSFELLGAAGSIRVFDTPVSAQGSDESGDEETDETQNEEEEESTDADESQAEEEPSASDESSASEEPSISEQSSTSESGATAVTQLTAENTTLTTSVDSTTDSALVPTTDPVTGGTVSESTTAPNPTGTGTVAARGTVAGVAFFDKDSLLGLKANSGSLMPDGQTQLVLDNNSLTGIYFVETQTNGGDCNPCTFSAENASLKDNGSFATSDNANIYWGRWDGDFQLLENGVLQDTDQSFLFIYSDRLTPLSVLQNKTGTYTYSAVSGKGSVQTESGLYGSIDYFSTISVDWNNQKVTSASLDLNGFSDSRSYDLNSAEAMGIEELYNGKELNITGSCSGGGCIGSSELEGHMSVNFVGDSANSIISSFSASEKGVAGAVSDVGVTGTAVFQ
ncbi:FecR family protein [Neptuniibacter halophilus]|uniref:FecR family protein n=1 Tax=Neptuniibacter halophilus TaxID=651666 RepID=UPI0025731DC2|nr:FecR family protein [Neptuniibacter halophilus]